MLEDIEHAYQKRGNIQVLYTVILEKSDKNVEKKIEIVSRFDTSDDADSILTSLNAIKASREDYNLDAYKHGEDTLNSIIMVLSNRNIYVEKATYNIQYDRIQARNWARDNRSAVPEYSSANGYGSDCANFVSRALNYGGIPQDINGKWAHHSNGSTIEAIKYTNWFRTGYNNNGGVAPYMVNKGYFYEDNSWTRAFAGSINYNTKSSHVGLVTAGDGANVFYADHSNVQKSGRETLLQTTSHTTADNSSFKSFMFYITNRTILK